MLKTMVKQFHQLETETAQALLQLEELRKKISEACGMDEFKDADIIQVPFAAYEMQLERHLEEKKTIEENHLKEKEQIQNRNDLEKDKMRKHYKNIILWVSIPFIAFIIAVFGTVAWFLNTYDIVGVTQDSAGINNYAYQTTQGDVIYEPKNLDDSTQETPEGSGSSNQ